MPALNTTPGMPASVAFCRAGPTASGLASVTAMPSTLLSMAFWISVACLPESGSLEYFRSIPCCLAACSAPARIRSQNVEPGASWVTMAMVKLGPPEAPPPEAPGAFWAPPWLLHAVTVRSSPAAAAVASFLWSIPL